MKKSLFALAAVTAFAGAAQAQSSVTVYGLLDIGYIGGNERISGPTINGQQVTKNNFNGIGNSAESTSRLGFRGTEDLGGGMSAFFNFETALSPNSNTFTSLQTRAANVGLAQKGVGRATIGTQNTVITDAISPTLTGQFANIPGSMIFASGSGPRATNNVNGNTDAFTFRQSSSVKLQSERMAGFQGSVMFVMNDQTQTQGNPAAITGSTINGGNSGGKNNTNGWGLGLNYNFKKFTGTAAYMALKAVDPYTISTVNTTGVQSVSVGAAAPFPSSDPGSGVNVTDNQAYVGATYDFGILKAYAGWINRKVTSQINSNSYAKRTAQEIGVRGNWTPKIESWASIGNGRFTASGTNEPTANINGWQVGSNYILSKRTNLYAIYGQSGTSNVSNSATGVNQSYNTNAYALGVRHTF
jgi:predicted porin